MEETTQAEACATYFPPFLRSSFRVTTNSFRVSKFEIPRDEEDPKTQVALDLNLNTNVALNSGDAMDRESDPFAITTIPGGNKSEN